jgi:heterotetrameric sarcosine oxidase gamma subunit
VNPASVDVRNPVRSSPLEAVHERLGARWRSPGLRWPLDYGDHAAEAEAVRLAAGLLDWGPLNKLVVQGAGTAAALGGAGLQFAPGVIVIQIAGGAKLHVWGVAPDEAILLFRHDIPLPAITARRASAADLSSALTAVRLTGPNARGILAELCPEDLGPDALHDLHVVQAPVANVRVTLARHDMAAIPGFTMLVPRDYAAHIWEALMRTGAHHGLMPVGNHVKEGF